MTRSEFGKELTDATPESTMYAYARMYMYVNAFFKITHSLPFYLIRSKYTQRSPPPQNCAMSSLWLPFLLLLQLLTTSLCHDTPPKGHFEPLGSHRVPELVPRLSRSRPPAEFYTEFVRLRRPVVLAGAVEGTDVAANWRDDEYLRWAYYCWFMRCEHPSLIYKFSAASFFW